MNSVKCSFVKIFQKIDASSLVHAVNAVDVFDWNLFLCPIFASRNCWLLQEKCESDSCNW